MKKEVFNSTNCRRRKEISGDKQRKNYHRPKLKSYFISGSDKFLIIGLTYSSKKDINNKKLFFITYVYEERNTVFISCVLGNSDDILSE